MSVRLEAGIVDEANQFPPARVVQGRHRPDHAPDLLAHLTEVAKSRPDAIAVESADGALTYAQLLSRVAQAAQELRARGIVQGAFVGISLTRGARELVTMLATLTVGAAYVPLDLSHPPERLRLILEDATPALWVRDRPAALESPQTPVWVFSKWEDLPPLQNGVPLVAPWSELESGEWLCYVLFTSGSTGRPKGVEIRRKALQSFLRSMAEEPGLLPGQRLFAVSPTSFDISGLELFLPLWVGGTTVIADRATVRDPRAWARALDEQRIDCLQATPSGWRLLLEAGWGGRPGLKMLCGGEPLTAPLAARLLEKGAELWNLYGPTETTVWSTLTRIRSSENITVGGPIDGTSLAIVGEDGSPLPPAEEGEIVIGGIGLARGYRARPELTEAAFFQPAWAPRGERFYRTGDRGRFSFDGQLVCLGRRDGQVKILGHRIELSEVEAALRSAEGVSEVVVLAEHAEDKDARLVAYWQGRAHPSDLLARARERLPAYMVPARYVPVAQFPLNPNGKIDRRALAHWVEEDGAPSSEPLAPARDWETCIAALWAEVLKRPHVGLDEDVFTLGATSLLAAELQDKLQALLGRNLPLSAVFEAPSPRALARHVEAGATGRENIVVRLRAGDPEKTPLFCLLGVALYRELADALTGFGDIYGLHVPGLHVPGLHVPGGPAFVGWGEGPVKETARHYVSALRQMRPHGPYALLGLCYGGIVAFEAARLLAAMGETIESVTILDAILPEGTKIDWTTRALTHLVRLRQAPRQWLSQSLTTARNLIVSHPLWKGLSPGKAVDADPSLDGPEADRAIATFARDRTPLQAPVLVVRALEAELPPWVSLASDLGWSSLAPRLRVLDLATGHLELLRRPFVNTVAAAVPRS